jgi:hypothetical protein
MPETNGAHEPDPAVQYLPFDDRAELATGGQK